MAEKESANRTAVLMKTSMGEIEIELYGDKSPVTVENFLKYVDSKFFNGTIFHRVIDNFMIQGGSMTPDMEERPGFPPIRNEADNKVQNDRGTIAMARTQDIHSATAQFFINVKDNNFLDNGESGFGYCVFGRVSKGMEVVDAIKKVKTGLRGYHDDVPVEPVMINSVERAE